MAFTRFHDDPCRITKQLQESLKRHRELLGYDPTKGTTSLNERRDRHIYLEHDDKKYKSIDELFLNVPNTMISKDYEFFGSNPPNDNHPSLLSQKIISDSIIKSINSDKLI